MVGNFVRFFQRHDRQGPQALSHPGKLGCAYFAAETTAFPVVQMLFFKHKKRDAHSRSHLWINMMSKRNCPALHDKKAPCLFTLF